MVSVDCLYFSKLKGPTPWPVERRNQTTAVKHYMANPFTEKLNSFSELSWNYELSVMHQHSDDSLLRLL